MNKLLLGLSLASLVAATSPSFAQQDDGQQNGAGAAFGAVLGGLVGGVVGAAVSGHSPRARDLLSSGVGGDRGNSKGGGGTHAGELSGAAKALPSRRKPAK